MIRRIDERRATLRKYSMKHQISNPGIYLVWIGVNPRAEGKNSHHIRSGGSRDVAKVTASHTLLR
eukprot:scaffold22697_cov119-Cylindrotheca_fusiformis.AAC.1